MVLVCELLGAQSAAQGGLKLVTRDEGELSGLTSRWDDPVWPIRWALAMVEGDGDRCRLDCIVGELARVVATEELA